MYVPVSYTHLDVYKRQPVCDTLMGKGVIEGTNKRYTGMIGMHGTKTCLLYTSSIKLIKIYVLKNEFIWVIIYELMWIFIIRN